MEANTLGYGEIRLIIAVVAVATQNHLKSSSNNSMSRSNFAMLEAIPLGVRCDDLEL